MGRSTGSFHFFHLGIDCLRVTACFALACATRPPASIETTCLPGKNVAGEQIGRVFARSDLVFSGTVIDYYPWPPPVEPHGDSFAPVTYQVLQVFKGQGLVRGIAVLVYQLARWPSALVDEELRLRATVFGAGRRVVVFVTQDGSDLHSREPDLGVVSATRDVLELLEQWPSR